MRGSACVLPLIVLHLRFFLTHPPPLGALGACEASNSSPLPSGGKGWVSGLLHTTLHSEACCYRGKYRRECLQNKFPRFVFHSFQDY